MSEKQRTRGQDDREASGADRGGASGRSGSGGEAEKQSQKASPWEWAFAGFSTLLVLGAIGYMMYQALSEPATPPKIEITLDQVVRTETGYVVAFWAHNYGQTTAASLVVEGTLQSDTGKVETSSTTIQYVPAEARRQAGLFFSHDPSRYRLELQPKGYDLP